jgi:hypothetical protein
MLGIRAGLTAAIHAATMPTEIGSAPPRVETSGEALPVDVRRAVAAGKAAASPVARVVPPDAITRIPEGPGAILVAMEAGDMTRVARAHQFAIVHRMEAEAGRTAPACAPTARDQGPAWRPMPEGQAWAGARVWTPCELIGYAIRD